MKNHIVLLASALLFGAATVQAQDDSGLNDARIVIEKNRTNTVQSEERSFEKIAPVPQGKNQPIMLNYSPVEFKASLDPLEPTIRVTGLKSEKLPHSKNGYFELGVGNYLNTYAQGYANTIRKKNMDAGVYLKHFSALQGPVDGNNSSSSENEIAGLLNYYTKKATINTKLGYERWANKFYGYPAGTEVNDAQLKQHFNFINFETKVEGTDQSAPLAFKGGMDYHFTGDRFNASEHLVKLDGDFAYRTGEIWQPGVMLKMDYANRQDSLASEGRLGLQVIPNVRLVFDQFDLSLGLNFAYQNDSTENPDNFMVFPYFSGTYKMSEYFGLFASLKGDMQFNSLYNVVRYNPWMAPEFSLQNAATPFDFSIGGKGKFSHYLNYSASLGVKQINNLMTVVNNPMDQAQFLTAYDSGKTTVFHVAAHLAYELNQIAAGTDFRYNNYSTSTLEAAFHLPTLDWNFWGKYRYDDKLSFSTQLHILGGLKALAPTTNEVTNLKTIVDLGVRADYQLNERFGAFAKIDNLLAQKYERFQYYPVRGFQLMVGASVTF